MTGHSPKVCVVTPVYNTGEHIAACIESVLNQTYGNFEYYISDNASTDETLSIAKRFEASDPRVTVIENSDHLPQIPNYNRAIRLVNKDAKYLKIIQADDLLMPECLERMVGIAETQDSIGMVSAYTVLQDHVFLDGLDFSEIIVEGREICRRYLNDGAYLFGNPTTSLFRMADVRKSDSWYSESSMFADTDVAFRVLMNSNFAHIHQVLTFVRVEEGTVSSRRKSLDLDALTRRTMLEKYGAKILSPDDFKKRKGVLSRRHYRVLGDGILTLRGKEYWSFHRSAMADAGISLNPLLIAVGVLVAAIRLLGNLEQTTRRLWDWMRK